MLYTFIRANQEPMVMFPSYFSRCVASYMARLGQCFSTSLDTVGITLQEGVVYREIDEVQDEANEFCFSDGIGTISSALARQVIDPHFTLKIIFI